MFGVGASRDWQALIVFVVLAVVLLAFEWIESVPVAEQGDTVLLE